MVKGWLDSGLVDRWSMHMYKWWLVHFFGWWAVWSLHVNGRCPALLIDVLLKLARMLELMHSRPMICNQQPWPLSSLFHSYIDQVTHITPMNSVYKNSNNVHEHTLHLSFHVIIILTSLTPQSIFFMAYFLISTHLIAYISLKVEFNMSDYGISHMSLVHDG